MMENRVELELGDLRINDLLECPNKMQIIENIKDSYVSIGSRDTTTAAYIAILLSSNNKVVLVNDIVVKSFDIMYVTGELVGWFKDVNILKLY